MRLFVGTFLGREHQAFYDQLAAWLVSMSPAVRRIPPASAHITYAFLGEVPDALAGGVFGAVAGAAGGHRPISVALGTPRVLYSGRRARLVYADVINGGLEMQDLARVIVERLRTACPSVEVSAMNAPHVTIARFRRSGTRADGEAVEGLLAARGLAGGSRGDRVAAVQVISSQLSGSGPVYRVVSEVPLG